MPPLKGIFSLRPPSTPMGIPIKLHHVIYAPGLIHFFKFFGVRETPPYGKFQSFLFRDYRYFLELHNTVEPLFNKVLYITNDTLHPCQSYRKMYGIEPRYNELRYN